MKLIRLTFAGKGIFRAIRALDDVDMEPWDEQDLYDADRDFEEHLEIPDIYAIHGQTKAYFTEEGYERFQEAIETLTFIINNYLGKNDMVRTETIESDGSNLLYLDKYQAVIGA